MSSLSPAYDCPHLGPRRDFQLSAQVIQLIENSEIIAFDFDGLVADTEELQMRAFAGLVEVEKGVVIPFGDIVQKMIGKPERTIISELSQEFGMKGDLDDLVNQRGQVYADSVCASDLRPNEEIIAIAHMAQQLGKECFILTNGRFSIIDRLCHHWGICDLFDELHTVDKRAIPDKVEFLLDKAQARGLQPEQVLLLEDGAGTLQKAAARGIQGIYGQHRFNAPDFVPNTGVVINIASYTHS